MNAFNLLKGALTSPLVLRLSGPNRPYSVDTDACDKQIGCALFQEFEDEKRHPIGFWNKTLTSAERNNLASERECLALIWAVQILRPYLEFRHFTVFIDHAGLKCVMSLTDVSNSRLARWRMQLLRFDMHIKYRKGSENTIADAISRLPTYGYTNEQPDLEILSFLIDALNNSDRAHRASFSSTIDSSSWSKLDWDPEGEERVDEAMDFGILAIATDAQVY